MPRGGDMVWLLALLACSTAVHPPEESTVPCPTRYVDADQDTWGGAVTQEDCDSVVGLVDRGGDCDDGDATTFPGAASVCDAAQDQDCDGVVDPDNSDLDEDGLSVCAGDCADGDPAIPRLGEACDGVDDDCDGLVDEDDPDHDLWECGFCETAEAWPGVATFEDHTLNPCLLDPPATVYCSEDPEDPDTHSDGRRLHRIAWRTDIALRDPLFLMLGSGDGADLNQLRQWAAFAGYRVLHLGYASSLDAFVGCVGLDPECSEGARGEIVYGIDGTDAYEITYDDSIVGRLDAVLRALDTEDPTMGWGSYLTGPGTFDWGRIVVFGWSEGAAFAHFLGGDFRAAASVVVSGPLELDQVTGLPVDWVIAPRATPVCASWGFAHGFERSIGDITLAWSMIGIEPDPPIQIEAGTPPYDDARALITTTLGTDPECTGHLSMAKDECLQVEAILPGYLHLFCEAGRLGIATCVD